MSEIEICLDGLKMNAVETDPKGVIGLSTIFTFHQEGQKVHCEYSGGKIEHGYLVGIVKGRNFQFRYCQLEIDGSLNSGSSNCELAINDESLVQIIEYFEWESKNGGGKNVIQELREIEVYQAAQTDS